MVKAGETMSGLKWVDIPPVWLLAFACGAWLLSPITPKTRGALFPVLGWLAIGVGALLMAAAVWEMQRHRTTPIPHKVPTAIVTSGVFRLTRNPIYLGDAIVFLGLILLWQSWLALPLLPLFIWLITKRFILAEEARLTARFAAEFAQWASATRRWI